MRNSDVKSRYLYIDNLRLAIIILVVMVHLAVTYSGIGDWYITDAGEPDIVSLLFFGLFQSFTQAYFMGFLFLISGYFVAKSYDRKGCKRFLKDRFIRLGIPVLIYMLVIHPFIIYVLLGSRWENPGFLKYYTDYIASFDFLGSSGPLWFAFALLVFNCFYALFRSIAKTRSIDSEKALPGLRSASAVIVMIAVFTFSVRIVQPIDTSILNMQLCFFSQYIILFIVGIKAGRYDWFSKLPYKKGRTWLVSAFVPGIIVWVVMLLAGGALDDGLYLFKGGLRWQSALYSLWESFTSVAMAIGLIAVFKEKYNKQNALVKAMSDSSFTVYMFHAPIIIALSLILIPITLHPVLKYILACIIGIPPTFLLCNYIRRIPVLKKIL